MMLDAVHILPRYWYNSMQLQGNYIIFAGRYKSSINIGCKNIYTLLVLIRYPILIVQLACIHKHTNNIQCEDCGKIVHSLAVNYMPEW